MVLVLNCSKVLGDTRKLGITAVVELYFGVTTDIAQVLVSSNFSLLEQNEMVLYYSNSYPSGYRVIRNKYLFDGYSKLLTKKDRKIFYNRLKKRIRRELPNIHI